MKYVLICHDGKDSEAMKRRLAVRDQHIEEIQKNKNFVFGTAILENEKMIGSVMVMDFKNKDQLNEYIKNEIYVTAKVWQNIETIECANGFFGSAFGK